LMMSLWDALRMNMMISYQELVRTFPYVLVLYSLLVVFVFIPDLIILPLKWIN
ncbi:hypothetical protein OU548_23195, partial [Escherichia coli]|nr:hypothetical protein [Escherichia coli]